MSPLRRREKKGSFVSARRRSTWPSSISHASRSRRAGDPLNDAPTRHPNAGSDPGSEGRCRGSGDRPGLWGRRLPRETVCLPGTLGPYPRAPAAWSYGSGAPTQGRQLHDDFEMAEESIERREDGGIGRGGRNDSHHHDEDQPSERWIEVGSQVNEGSSFRVWLSLSPERTLNKLKGESHEKHATC